jgi:predicted amidohydrolase YtcJ
MVRPRESHPGLIATMNRDETADLVVRAGTVHTFDGAAGLTAFAVREGSVVASSGRDNEADLLRAWTGPDTRVIDDPELVVLPAFVDTHCHLTLAARSVFGVRTQDARTIADLIDAIRLRAADTPAGQWIVTAANWHEYQLAERRLPTAPELDRATIDHPVLVLRGGHNGVVNSLGLHMAGIDRDTPDAPGGVVFRDAAGNPTGWLQDLAMAPVLAVLPPTPPDVVADALATTSEIFASHGIGTVRDPAVGPAEWQVATKVAADGRFRVRSLPMIMSTPATIAAAGSITSYLDGLEDRGITPGAGDGLLRLWGLKFVLDGGAEAAAFTEPYPNRPDYYGELMWETAELAEALAICARRGWPVGTHAFGDRAVGVLLDAIGLVIEREGPLEPDLLVVEHGGLIRPDQIARATALGVHITAQQALVAGLAEPFVEAFGRQRAGDLMPLRELLDAGVRVSAGTDHPIGPVDPLAGVHGMTTRATPFGVLGAEHAISRAEALRLYTVAGAEFLGQYAGSPLRRGAPADFVAYRADPLTCPVDDLLTLRPALTAVDGTLTYQRYPQDMD